METETQEGVQVVEIEVSNGKHKIWRTVAVTNGALPEDTDLFVQSMVDTLLDDKEVF